MRTSPLISNPLMRVASVCILLYPSFPTVLAAAQDASPGELTITILEGDNAIVNVRQRVSREAIVQVEDENHKPVGGAIVTFLTPSDGPSATFMNGSHTITATTDVQGRVVMRGITSNKVAGKFDMKVTATKNGKSTSVIMSQTNVMAAAAAAGGISAKALGILLGVGGAAAVGIAVGLAGGKGNTTPTPVPPASTAVTLQPGTPVIGPPR